MNLQKIDESTDQGTIIFKRFPSDPNALIRLHELDARILNICEPYPFGT